MYTNHLVFDLLSTPDLPQSRLWDSTEGVFHDAVAPTVDGLDTFDVEFRENLFRKVSDYAIEEIDSVTLAEFFAWEQRTQLLSLKLSARTKGEGRVAAMWTHIREFLDLTFSAFDITEVEPRMTHGASHNANRGTHPLYYFGSKWHIDTALAKALRAAGVHDPMTSILEEIPERDPELPVLALVPKTWKTKRVIVKPLRHKQIWQSGISDWMTPRLKRQTGYDPVTAKDKHMALARLGSYTSSWYTIDLSHASDTVGAIWLDAFPSELAHWLRLTRDDVCALPDGGCHTLSMLAGAGNGWTFVVETAVFYSLIYGVLRMKGYACKRALSYIRDSASVFGDDILIKDAKVAKAVFDALVGMGFSPNMEKSYLSGHRRESCGGDYLNGFSMRSFYAKKRPETVQEWIAFCNGIRRVCYRDGSWIGGRGGYYDQLWRLCVRRVSELFAESPLAGRFHGNVPCGPSWLGDAVVGVTDEWGTPIPGFPGNFPVGIPGYGTLDLHLDYTLGRRIGSIVAYVETTKVVEARTFEQERRRARAPWAAAIQAYLAEPTLSRSAMPYVIPRSGDLKRDTIPVDIAVQHTAKAVSTSQTRFVEGDIDSLFESLSQKQRNWLSRRSVRERIAHELRSMYVHNIWGSHTPMCTLAGITRPKAAELGSGSKVRWVASEAAQVWD